MVDAANTGRRTFLIGAAFASGGVAFGLCLPIASAATKRGTAATATEVNAWVVIGADNSVTLRVPQAELGQGAVTTIAQLVGEELYLHPSRLRTEFYDPTTNLLRNNVYTFTATVSSLAVDRLFVPARVAGAQVRTMLVQVAARQLGVSPSELQVHDAHIFHDASKRPRTFAELAEQAAALPLPPADGVRLLAPADWKYIGKPVKRLDSRAKVDGSAVFGIDVQLPGMKYAAIRQSPVFGGRLKAFDAASVRDRKGVRGVVRINGGRTGLNEPPELGADDWSMDDAVAVVADSWWQAQKALKALPVEWESGKTFYFSSDGLVKEMEYMLERGGYPLRVDGDATAALQNAASTITADYSFPYMEHACLEPMNCTAWMRNGSLEIWAPTQYADEAVRVAAHAADLPIRNVKLHLTYVGGGFGRRLNSDFVSQAVQIAKQMPGVPVKLLWSREETFRKGFYPAPAAGRFTGGLDSHGNLIAWKCSAVFAKKFDQSYAPVRIAQLIPNVQVDVSTIDTPIPFGWMRGVAWTQFAWMTQGFLDELAHEARRDPLAFQLALLQADRLPAAMPNRDFAAARMRTQSRVLTEAARLAGWGTPMSRRRGRGLAVSDFSYWNEYRTSTTAAIVEVTLDGDGWLSVDRAVVVMECGVVVNPGIVLAQIEGSVGWALSNALYSEITIKNGQVEQGNFHEYPIMRIAEMPRVEAHILASDSEPTGVGEDAVPVTIGALVNAIWAAGGPRVRALPIARQKPLKLRA